MAMAADGRIALAGTDTEVYSFASNHNAGANGVLSTFAPDGGLNWQEDAGATPAGSAFGKIQDVGAVMFDQRRRSRRHKLPRGNERALSRLQPDEGRCAESPLHD